MYHLVHTLSCGLIIAVQWVMYQLQCQPFLFSGQLLRFGNASEVQLNNVTVISPRDNKTGALFACGAYIEAQAESGIISVLVVSLPDSFKNAVRGLMGNYNGDQSDDLQPKDGGSDPLPLDSSLETIHTQFGLTCELSPVVL